MLMKHRGPFFLCRHRRLHHRSSPWWKVIIFLSSTSLTSTLSPQLRPISFFAPILAQAAFHPSRSKFDFGRRKIVSMTLIPATPMAGTIPSPVPSGFCLRRSARITSNQICDTTIQRKGVRLFQQRSSDVEGESNRGNGDNGSNIVSSDSTDVPVTVPKKRRVTRSSRRTIDESDGTSQTVSKPVRGSKAIPVTPEPVLAENDDDADPVQSPPKKNKTKAKSPKVKSKSKTKTKTAKPKTSSKTKKKASRAVVSWPAPDDWLDTYELVRELRKDKTAPCDFMGAEALALPPTNKDNNDDGDAEMDDEERAKISRFQTLIALMLSSQTKDAMVGQAMENLRDTSDGSGGLTVASILEMDPKVLNTKIYSVGFRNNKTKYIKQAAQILHDEYNGDIPPTAGEMIRDLPGVGPKMAYIVENICWDRQSGIGVDTHMQRLFPKLGWVSPDTKNPEQTRKQLESWLPQDYWGEVNLLWVGFGQEVQQERQKVLRKVLLCSRPLEALTLLRAVDFDIYSEWNKMQSSDLLASDEDKKDGIVWTNDDEREKLNNLIEEVMSKK